MGSGPASGSHRLSARCHRATGRQIRGSRLNLPVRIAAGIFTEPRPFKLMLETWRHVSAIETDENKSPISARKPHRAFSPSSATCWTPRGRKCRSGSRRFGKAFRNEIKPRNYTFRSREFEQMELEFFITPDEVVEA